MVKKGLTKNTSGSQKSKLFLKSFLSCVGCEEPTPPQKNFFLKSQSSLCMLFYYLAPLQNDSIVTSRCMQFTFGDKREVYLFVI